MKSVISADRRKFNAIPVKSRVVGDLRTPPESRRMNKAVPAAPKNATSGTCHIPVAPPTNPRNAASDTPNAAPLEIPNT
jgi:hypothetical protein